MARGPQKWSQKVTHWYSRGEKSKRVRPIYRWEDDMEQYGLERRKIESYGRA
jgi:hypothetical protein